MADEKTKDEKVEVKESKADVPQPPAEKVEEPQPEKPAEKAEKPTESEAPPEEPSEPETPPEEKPELEVKEEKKEAEKKEEKPEAKPAEKAEKKPVAKKEEDKAEEKPSEKPTEKKGEVKKEDEKPSEKPAEKNVDGKAEDKKPEAEKEPRGPKKPLGIPPSVLLLFGRYDVSEVVVHDAGLARYINLDPVSVPHSGAKHANRPFAKWKVHIVERLVNNMMRTESNTGKKTKTYKIVSKAFDIIGSKTKKNPVQILIDAIENCTPREEVTRLRYGGVSVPKAVDTSSSRRLDLALRNISKGAVAATHKSTTPIEVCLANEIMLAAKGDMNSFAVARKDEAERIAGSAR